MDGSIRRVDFIQFHLESVFAKDIHANRIASLANGTPGVMTSASLAVSVIGKALAQARGLLAKHAIKQVDRMPNNRGIVVWNLFGPWMAEMVGGVPRSLPRWTGPISMLTVR